MVGVLFDTCILIDYLRGVSGAQAEVDGADDAAISIVSWMEVLAGAPEGTGDPTRVFLERFTLIPLDARIADAAVAIRRECRLKLPDAIILATADAGRRILVTRDEKAFGPASASVRMPYRL